MKNFAIKKIIFMLQEIFKKNSIEFANSRCNIHVSKTNCVLLIPEKFFPAINAKNTTKN